MMYDPAVIARAVYKAKLVTAALPAGEGPVRVSLQMSPERPEGPARTVTVEVDPALDVDAQVRAALEGA